MSSTDSYSNCENAVNSYTKKKKKYVRNPQGQGQLTYNSFTFNVLYNISLEKAIFTLNTFNLFNKNIPITVLCHHFQSLTPNMT